MADTNTITLKTRLLNKYNSSVELMKGEINFIPATMSDGSADLVIMQVGAGDGVVKEFAAKASDVHSWAKASTKPTYTAADFPWLAEFISGEIEDTNTKYMLEESAGQLILKYKDLGDTEWKQVGSPIDIVTPDELTAILADYVTTSALNTTLAGYVTSNDFNLHKVDNDTKIKEAKKAGDDAAAALGEYETANDAAVAAVKATADAAAVKTEVDAAIEGIEADIEAVEATANAAATQEAFEAYKSSNDAALAGVKATADAAAVKATVDAKFETVDSNIAATNTRITELTTAVNGHYETANTNFAALEAKDTELEGKITAEAEARAEADEALAADIAAAETAAKAYADEIKADLLGDDLADTFNTLKDIQDWVDNHEDVTVLGLTQAIANETAKREAADAAFTQADADLEAAIEAEEAARIEADGILDGKIAKEIEDRTAADTALDGKITAEASARAQGDADTLAAAKAYTDAEIVKAKAHADQAEADAIATAAEDATTKADAALEAAKKYADSLDHEDTTYDAGEGLVLDPATNIFSIDKSLTFILDANA